MAYSPIALVAPNYRDYTDYWLKAYEPGTTTPKIIALDSGATITVAKLQLNADGFLKSAGGALVIPYIEDSYDLWLFPTEAEADANDTINAEKLADNITGSNQAVIDQLNINDLSLSYTFKSKLLMVASLISFPVGKKIFWQGYYAESDGGSNWGLVKSGAHTDDGGSIFTLADGKYVEANLKGQSVSILKFGARGDYDIDADAGTNNSPFVQATIDYAESTVLIKAGIDHRAGKDVIFPEGVYSVATPMRVSKSNISLIGRGGATFTPALWDVVTSANPAMFIIGSAETWLSSGTISNTTKYNKLKSFRISRTVGRSPIAIMLSGTRNTSIVDLNVEQCFAGLWLENVSELSCRQLSHIGCNYGIIGDARKNRSAADSPLGVANIDNDCSACTFHQYTGYFIQHTGILLANSGTMSFYGATLGSFSDIPIPGGNLRYGLPGAAVGVHFWGANTNFTKGGLLDDFVYEPTQSETRTCILLTSNNQNNPLRGITLRNQHVQTYAKNYTTGAVTKLLQLQAYDGGTIDSVTLKDSGFTMATTGFNYPILVDQSLAADVGFPVTDASVKIENCYPSVALSTSNVGASRVSDIEYIEQTNMEINKEASGAPEGWIKTAGSGVTPLGGSAGEEAYVRLTGNGGSASVMEKTFNYRPYISRLGSPFISVWYRGDTAPHIDVEVNGVAATSRLIKSGDNIGRYSNAIEDKPQTTLWTRAIYTFKTFSANTPFDSMKVGLGRLSNGGTNYTEFKNIEIGFYTIKETVYNPF